MAKRRLQRRLLSYAVLKSEKGVSYSKQHLKRLEEAGAFPRRVPIGENRYAWIESEVDGWLEQKIAARDGVAAATEDADTPTTTKCAHAASARRAT
jgi:prophage regulatory protein